MLISPLIANYWLRPEKLSPQTVKWAIVLMGLVMLFRWPNALYSGGLLGLQQQVKYNLVLCVAATLRGLGVVLVLRFISPTILAFFIWQILVSIIETSLNAWFLWRCLPIAEQRACFRRSILLRIWRFAAGITGITLLSLVLTQLDMLILSKLLTLKDFGYYSFAFTTSNVLGYLTQPIFIALFPRFCQLVTEKDDKALTTLYHNGCRMLSTVIIPAGIVVALFSRELLSLWTRNLQVVSHVHVLLSIIIIGTLLNSIMLLPYALQIANGWTKLSLYKNIIAVACFVPLLLMMISRYNVVGAAIMWIVVNAGYFVFEVPVMHRRLLKGEMWTWLFKDVGGPLAISLIIGGIARILISESAHTTFVVSMIFLTWLSATFISAMAVPSIRRRLLCYISGGRRIDSAS